MYILVYIYIPYIHRYRCCNFIDTSNCPINIAVIYIYIHIYIHYIYIYIYIYTYIYTHIYIYINIYNITKGKQHLVSHPISMVPPRGIWNVPPLGSVEATHLLRGRKHPKVWELTSVDSMGYLPRVDVENRTGFPWNMIYFDFVGFPADFSVAHRLRNRTRCCGCSERG